MASGKSGSRDAIRMIIDDKFHNEAEAVRRIFEERNKFCS